MAFEIEECNCSEEGAVDMQGAVDIKEQLNLIRVHMIDMEIEALKRKILENTEKLPKNYPESHFINYNFLVSAIFAVLVLKSFLLYCGSKKVRNLKIENKKLKKTSKCSNPYPNYSDRTFYRQPIIKSQEHIADEDEEMNDVPISAKDFKENGTFNPVKHAEISSNSTVALNVTLVYIFAAKENL